MGDVEGGGLPPPRSMDFSKNKFEKVGSKANNNIKKLKSFFYNRLFFSHEYCTTINNEDSLKGLESKEY
jgi:hypothetical protein